MADFEYLKTHEMTRENYNNFRFTTIVERFELAEIKRRVTDEERICSKFEIILSAFLLARGLWNRYRAMDRAEFIDNALGNQGAVVIGANNDNNGAYITIGQHANPNFNNVILGYQHRHA